MESRKEVYSTSSMSAQLESHARDFGDLFESQGYSPQTLQSYRATAQNMHAAMIAKGLLPKDLPYLGLSYPPANMKHSSLQIQSIWQQTQNSGR